MKGKMITELTPYMVFADYEPAELPKHKGNPLIEALRLRGKLTEITTNFGHFPEMPPNLSDWGRMQAVDLLDQDFFQPLPNYYEVIQQVFLSLSSGYTFRNPTKKVYRKLMVKYYKNAQKGQIQSIFPWEPANMPGFALLGCSGVGKSTVIKRTLSYLPQGIIHRKFHIAQMVYVRVECPPDGSMKQFLLSVITEFDRVLNSNYIDDYGGLTTDGLILAVGFLAVFHHLGMLVIDEIQNLLDSKAHSEAVLLNYLVSLSNAIRVPIVYVGTIRAMQLCQTAFRQGRRVGTPFVWDKLIENSKAWKLLLESLWQYQWSDPVILSKELSDIMYDRTQGIHALVVLLFKHSQKAALRNKVPLSEELIDSVAMEKFILLKPMLDSLREWAKDPIKDPIEFWKDRKTKKYEDLIYQVVMLANTGVQCEQAKNIERQNPEIKHTFEALKQLGYNKSVYESYILLLFEKDPSLTSNKAVNAFVSEFEQPVGNQDNSKPVTLKEIAEAAKASDKTPLQGLQEAGLSPLPPKMGRGK